MRRENVRRMKKKKEMRKRFLSVISTTKNKIKKLIKKKIPTYTGASKSPLKLLKALS